ncbi:MAG: alpha/beta hydrolase [Granulosicoccus sp.]
MNLETDAHPALLELLENPVTPQALQKFVQTREFPLVVAGLVTFVWVGEASRISLVRWIHGGEDRIDFRHMKGTPLWLLHVPVEDGGRFEYKLSIRCGREERLALDPLNDKRAGDPYGENSVCKTYGYARPEWSKPQGAPAGSIIPLIVSSAAFDQTRQEQIYLPKDYDGKTAMPLLVIHDGADFVTYADLATSLDNLIYAGTIPPCVVALLQTSDRPGEYSRGRRHARYIVSDLLPVLEEKFALSDRVCDRILLGASLGAVVSLSTVFRYPGVFGGVVLHSGSFILDDRKLQGRPHPVFRRIARLVKAFRRAPDIPELRAFVSTGELEGLASENRALARLLEENGVKVLFKSAWDGHHWHNWRNQLRDGLVWVLKNSAD